MAFEVANHVLAHLTGSNVKESTVDFTPPIKFSHKEQNIIKYLSGYVFGTRYRRIRTSKSCQNMFGVQSLHILLAGKLSLEENSSNDILIRAKDRGLWTVTAEVFEIFSHVESKFHQNIDSKKIVSDLLKNPIVLCNYNKLRYDESTEKISKEIAMNLLEHLIMLYVRIRVFSLVKDKCELHKISSKKKKVISLRTEIKKLLSVWTKGIEPKKSQTVTIILLKRLFLTG